MGKGDVCEVCGSTKQVHVSKKYGMTVCKRHYQQLNVAGEITIKNTRTHLDPNEIIIYDDYAEVVMYNKKSEEAARAKIDIEDVDKVKKYKWNLGSDKYAVSKTIDQKRVAMHRYLMDCPEHLVTDHISGDRLDNRKGNLRNCTFNENLLNQKIRVSNISGCKGVSWDNVKKNWTARITVKGKYYYMGNYELFDDAVKARKSAEIKYQGDFAFREVV